MSRRGNDGGAGDAIRALRPSPDDLIPAEQRERLKRRTREGAWWVDPYAVEPPAGFRIVVDTREQLELFGAASFAIRGCLPTGDYSLEGFEDRICIERKSLPDLYGSCVPSRDDPGRRDRLKAEFERMSRMERAALLVEGTYQELLRPEAAFPRWHSQTQPESVEGTVFAWCARYGVEMLLASRDRMLSERMAFRWLSQWWLEKGIGT